MNTKMNNMGTNDEIIYLTIPIRSNDEEMDLNIFLRHTKNNIDIKYTCGKTLQKDMSNDVKDYFITFNKTKFIKRITDYEYKTKYSWIEKFISNKTIYHLNF